MYLWQGTAGQVFSPVQPGAGSGAGRVPDPGDPAHPAGGALPSDKDPATGLGGSVSQQSHGPAVGGGRQPLAGGRSELFSCLKLIDKLGKECRNCFTHQIIF